MKEMYTEGKFSFIVLDKEVVNKLTQIPVEEMFVTAGTAKLISNILEFNTYSNDELQALRNSIVKDFPRNDNNWTRKSMIIAVIDDEKLKRGMAL